mgnify:CR=1 FL=1
MIKVGDQIPASTLMEYVEVEGNGCSVGPNPVDTHKASAGKTIAVFALPGAFTPTCSAKHVPGYVEHAEAFKAAGVDEIWCVSVNDAFVMGAWGRDQKTAGKVRMMADGAADYTKKLGLEFDVPNLGVRCRRHLPAADRTGPTWPARRPAGTGAGARGARARPARTRHVCVPRASLRRRHRRLPLPATAPGDAVARYRRCTGVRSRRATGW